MKDFAIRELANFIIPRLEGSEMKDRIRVYQALAEVMPTTDERRAAKNMAIALSAVEARQLEFSQMLQFNTIS